MVDFQLGPDVDFEDDEDIDIEGDESTEKGGGAPELSEVERLRAELDAARSLNTKQIEDLRRTVGRMQSVAAKADSVSKADLETALSAGFGSVHELLAAIVESADPTVFPDTLKQQMAKTLADAKRRADRDSLREEVLATLPKAQQPQDEPELQPHQLVEAMILAELQAADIDPDDLDWKAVDKEWLANGEGGALAAARQQIIAAKGETEVATRRQARKTAAPQSPKGGSGGAAKTDADIFLDPSQPFDKRMEIFKRMIK